MNHTLHRTPFAAAICAALAASAFAAPAPQSTCQLQALEPAIGEFATGFDVDATKLAAQFDDGQGSTGIELMQRDGPTWTTIGTLPASAPIHDGFGDAIDIEGYSVIASVPNRVQQTTGFRGEIWTFGDTPFGWIRLPDISTTYSLAHVFGDRFEREGDVLIARSTTNGFAGRENQLHVFMDSPALGWSETQLIRDPNPVMGGPAGSTFGEGLAVSGPWLAAGGTNTNGGRAYVWRRSAASYGNMQELDIPLARSYAYGSEIAINGDQIAVSDPMIEGLPGQNGRGAIHIFGYDALTASFRYVSTQVHPGWFVVSSFGQSIDWDGDRLVATFLTENLFSNTDIEGLVLFEGFGTTAQRFEVIFASSALPQETVGRSVHLTRDEILTAERSWSQLMQTRPLGKLGRWSLGPVGVLECLGQPNSTGSAAAAHITGCPTFDSLTVTVESLPIGSVGVLLLGTGSAQIPVGSGTLCIQAPQRVALALVNGMGVSVTTCAPDLAGFAPGDVVLTQLWYRDIGTTNLSHALAVELTN